jgi:hypothetical protein
MNITAAKEQLVRFLQGRTLTFSFEELGEGEWIAQCNEIPGIVSSGTNTTRAKTEELLRDAILSAAGLDSTKPSIRKLLTRTVTRVTFDASTGQRKPSFSRVPALDGISST